MVYRTYIDMVALSPVDISTTPILLGPNHIVFITVLVLKCIF